ncbi:MAG: hypothetical protein U0931_14100 [Vulcanimicrobiota bacterium]
MRKWTGWLAIALTFSLGAGPGWSLPERVPEQTRQMWALEAEGNWDWQKWPQAISARGQRLRSVVEIFEGMSLRLPLPIQVLIACSKTPGSVQLPLEYFGFPPGSPRLSLDRLTQGLKPSGWWVILAGGEWAACWEIRDRQVLLAEQERILGEGISGPSPAEKCGSNLRNLATAIEMYQQDCQRLPERLSQLTPNYLRELPECPVAHQKTYGLQQVGAADFKLHCAGDHHGLGPGLPAYSSQEGLSSFTHERVSLVKPLGPEGGYVVEGAPLWRIDQDRVWCASSPTALRAVQTAAVSGRQVENPPGSPGQSRLLLWTPERPVQRWQLALASPSALIQLELRPGHAALRSVETDSLTPTYVPADWENFLSTDLERLVAIYTGEVPNGLNLSLCNQLHQSLKALDGRCTLAVPGADLAAWLESQEKVEIANACLDNLEALGRRLEEARARSGRLPKRLQDLPNAGYLLTCPGGGAHRLAYVPAGKLFRLYCPGERHRLAGLAPNHPQRGDRQLAPTPPPGLLVARVRDWAETEKLVASWKGGYSRLDREHGLLLWAQGAQAEDYLKAAQECAQGSRPNLLSLPEVASGLKQAGVFQLEGSGLAPIREALKRSDWARTWQAWNQGQPGDPNQWYGTMIAAMVSGPWLELGESAMGRGFGLGRVTEHGLRFEQASGLPWLCWLLPPAVEHWADWTDPPSPGQICASNLKNLATGLEMYASDHKGHYPARLELLVPDYLNSIPLCPEARRATYQLRLQGGVFRLLCAGKNHQGWPADMPAYGSDSGLSVPDKP